MKIVQVMYRDWDEEEKLNTARRVLEQTLNERVGSDAEDRLDFLEYLAIQIDAMMDEIEEDAGVMLAA